MGVNRKKELPLASAADWERCRGLITQLYQEQELEELMDVMKQSYNFYSTRKIYKNHIKEWNIGKRLCDSDVLAILDFGEGQCPGTKRRHTEFWIRGHRVSEKNITRYLRRKPEVATRFKNGDRASEEESNQVVCKRRPSRPRRRSQKPSADPLSDVELLFLDIRAYARLCFCHGTWKSDEQGECSASAEGDRASEACDGADLEFSLATQAIGDGNHSKSRRHMDSCVSHLCDTMALEDPYFLETLVSIIVELRHRDYNGLLEDLLNTLMQSAVAVHGDTHKLTGIIYRLQQLELKGNTKDITRALDVLGEEVDKRLGKGSRFGTVMLVTRTQLAHDMGSQEVATRLKKRLDRVPKARKSDNWVVDLRLHYSWAVCRWKCEVGLLEEAERVLYAAEPYLVTDFHRASFHSVLGDFYSLHGHSLEVAKNQYEVAHLGAQGDRHEGVVKRCASSLDGATELLQEVEDAMFLDLSAECRECKILDGMYSVD